MRGMLTSRSWIGLVAVVVLVGGGLWLWRQFFGGYHYRAVAQEILYRDGMRDPREFLRACRRGKIKTVVSLIEPGEYATEPLGREEELCRQASVALVRLPIALGGWPTDESLRQFVNMLDDPGKRPVLVHCAQGVRRTGMMVAAWQLSSGGLTVQQTKAAMATFGHSRRTVGDIERFIDHYDPVARRMTEQLPPGKE